MLKQQTGLRAHKIESIAESEGSSQAESPLSSSVGGVFVGRISAFHKISGAKITTGQISRAILVLFVLAQKEMVVD